ncbi:Stf0 family sulfotransferase [Kordiimonas pumila]|uniref:Stf0 family sulfotransferase n=1 Tax=Kordiimonas pumila TaxID=2161677 RepID=A0ABV7D8W4_9PROT|nr:Stf0 family sulfotransferase [Kordiimonas pumila]
MRYNDTKKMLDNVIEEILAREPINPKDMTGYYGVISTPRSGSTMFGDKLYQTGLMGYPMEWFNIRYLRAYKRVKGVQTLNFSHYLKDIAYRAASPNGIFGVNFHVDQYLDMQKRGIDFFKHFRFDKLYYVSRNDKFSQAYSLAKARATDVWSSNVIPDAEAADKIAAIKDSDILRELLRITGWQEQYEKSLQAKVHRSYSYEDFSSITKGGDIFREILADFKLQVPEDYKFMTAFKKQSDTADKERIETLRQHLLGPV